MKFPSTTKEPEMTVKMYTTGCPKCNVMKRKLDEAKIPYEAVTDNATILSVATKAGISMAPLLEVDGVVMNFKDGCDWINKNQE
jgi:glutaredoxin